MNSQVLKLATKKGILMGLCFCAYTFIMWITKLDSQFLVYGQYLDIAIILLPILLILFSIKQSLKIAELTTIHRILLAIYIGLLSQLIYSPFLYIYHNFINPNWFDAVIELKINSLKIENIAEDKISSIVEKIKLNNIAQNEIYSLSSFIPSVFILPTLIALISLLFKKWKNNLR
jgi:hypothetical protein